VDTVRRWQFQPGSGPAARRRVEAILNTIGRLRRYPCLYALGDHPGTREVSSEGHRIVYVVDRPADFSLPNRRYADVGITYSVFRLATRRTGGPVGIPKADPRR
jgi:hypothetical protein